MEMSTLERTKRKKKNTDIKKLLDEHFKPIFGKNPKEGISIKDLIAHIEESRISSMPEMKLRQIMHMFDENNDGLISYKEFTTLMLAEHERFDLDKLSGFERFVLEITATTIPHSMQKDYIDHYSCKPPPLFMILISLIEIAGFIYYTVLLKDRCFIVDSMNGVPQWSPMIYNPYRRYEAWRYLTYVIIHIGYVHLITNLVFQLFLGIPLEMVHTWWRILLVYGCGAITGSLAHSIADPNAMLAGASGGAYAIAVAHVANVIMNWEEMQVDWFKAKPCRIILSAPVRLVVILLIAGVDTGLAVWNKYWSENMESEVGIAAHLGGMATGLLLGIPVLKNIDKKPWETILFWVALIIWTVCVIAAILMNVLWEERFPMYNSEDRTDWTPIGQSVTVPNCCDCKQAVYEYQCALYPTACIVNATTP